MVVVVGLEAGAHHVRKVAVPLVSHCGEERERERERGKYSADRIYGQIGCMVSTLLWFQYANLSNFLELP